MGSFIYFIGMFSILLSLSCRKQFDLANMEAMEESAEWRLKYDEQVQRATQLLRELEQV